jgi:hypothetical protein
MTHARALVLALTLALATAAALQSSGCTRMETTARDADSALSPSPSTTVAPVSPGFVNRVWQVIDSTDVQTGSMYVFLSDGTLVMTSPNGTPSLGTWKLSPAGLTMVEEGIAYETEILALEPEALRLRSKNPGGAAEIRLAPADTPPYTP